MNNNISIFTEDFDDSKNSAGRVMVDLVIELGKKTSGFVDVFTLSKSKKNVTPNPDFLLNDSNNIRVYRMFVSDKSNMSLLKRAIFEILLSPRMFIFILRKRKLFSFCNIIWYSPTIFWSPLILVLSIFNRATKFLILRFGKIRTQMSEGHSNPPFTLNRSEAASLIIKFIEKEGVLYPTIGLRMMAIFIKLMPTKLLDLIEKNI